MSRLKSLLEAKAGNRSGRVSRKKVGVEFEQIVANRGHSSSVGKASWIKVPQRGATEPTGVRFPVAEYELGEKS